MFFSCHSITAVPSDYLPITTLSASCYYQMFKDCRNLTNVPTLPATALTTECYREMFEQCYSLTAVPSDLLPATTLATGCYRGLFYNCTGLTSAPDLPATTLVTHCYYYMFGYCTHLNYVKCLATDISASNSVVGWMNNVQTTSGTFVKHPDMNDWTRGQNGIPSNWTVQDAVL